MIIIIQDAFCLNVNINNFQTLNVLHSKCSSCPVSLFFRFIYFDEMKKNYKRK